MGSSNDAIKTVSRAAQRPQAKASARGLLTVVFPRTLGWQLELCAERVIIGRLPAEGVHALNHATVSRRHLSIRFDADKRRHVATDMGSHNGSKVNGVAIGENDAVVLEDNAVIEIGDVLLVLERGADVADAPADVNVERIPGRARQMRLVRALIGRAARDPSPVMVIGETGTGKEWVAREVHRVSGRSGKLLAINCAALSPQLIESELFGHVKGAFTGAASDHRGFFVEADGGSLFLDELGELPASLQPKLLRVLQEHEVRPVGGTTTRTVDVRVIAATNRDLAAELREGRFRRDLYARLALWEITLPPLRQRRVDILTWFERLHRAWASERELGEVDPPRFSPEAAAIVLLYDWPDNLRGLDRLVHTLSAAEVESAQAIEGEHLPAWLSEDKATGATSVEVPAKPTRPPAPSREEFERVLDELEGNVSAVAKHFGRDRRQVYRWLEAFDLREKRQGRKQSE